MCFPDSAHKLSDDLESFILVLRWCLYKFFEHTMSHDKELLADVFFHYFDDCTGSATSLIGHRFLQANGDAIAWIPEPLPGGTGNLLNFLLARFARLCCEHDYSPDVLPLWEREELIDDDDEAFFGDSRVASAPTPVPRRRPRVRSWCSVTLPVTISPLTDHNEVMRAFDMVVARPPELWHEETRKKLPDQVSQGLMRTFSYPICYRHHHY